MEKLDHGKLKSLNLTPAWPLFNQLLPLKRPTQRTKTTVWQYKDIRENLILSSKVVPIESAQRRVMVLSNPGFGENAIRTTACLYGGIQLILPGERAPNHKHSHTATRLIIEGEGGIAIIDGKEHKMNKGDLIITPPWFWHEHFNTKDSPVLWLDILDLPIVEEFDISFGEIEETGNENQPLPCQTFRFPWEETKENLLNLGKNIEIGKSVRINYVDPKTHQSAVKTIGLSALMVRPNETIEIQESYVSSIMHIIEGHISIKVNEESYEVKASDTLSVPRYANVTLTNQSNTHVFIFIADDSHTLTNLGIFQ